MSSIPPNQSVYIQNLPEKIKKEGESFPEPVAIILLDSGVWGPLS